jgi:hypothetical protein
MRRRLIAIVLVFVSSIVLYLTRIKPLCISTTDEPHSNGKVVTNTSVQDPPANQTNPTTTERPKRELSLTEEVSTTTTSSNEIHESHNITFTPSAVPPLNSSVTVQVQHKNITLPSTPFHTSSTVLPSNSSSMIQGQDGNITLFSTSTVLPLISGDINKTSDQKTQYVSPMPESNASPINANNTYEVETYTESSSSSAVPPSNLSDTERLHQQQQQQQQKQKQQQGITNSTSSPSPSTTPNAGIEASRKNHQIPPSSSSVLKTNVPPLNESNMYPVHEIVTTPTTSTSVGIEKSQGRQKISSSSSPLTSTVQPLNSSIVQENTTLMASVSSSSSTAPSNSNPEIEEGGRKQQITPTQSPLTSTVPPLNSSVQQNTTLIPPSASSPTALTFKSSVDTEETQRRQQISTSPSLGPPTSTVLSLNSSDTDRIPVNNTWIPRTSSSTTINLNASDAVIEESQNKRNPLNSSDTVFIPINTTATTIPSASNASVEEKQKRRNPLNSNYTDPTPVKDTNTTIPFTNLNASDAFIENSEKIKPLNSSDTDRVKENTTPIPTMSSTAAPTSNASDEIVSKMNYSQTVETDPRSKRSIDRGGKLAMEPSCLPYAPILQDILASVVITENEQIDRNDPLSCVLQKNIHCLANAGEAPVFITTTKSPAYFLDERIKAIMRQDDLTLLKPYYMATKPTIMDGGVHVPAGWSQKTLAYYSKISDEYIIIYDPTLAEKPLSDPMVRNKGSNVTNAYIGTRGMGIYGRGCGDIGYSCARQFSIQYDRARFLPLVSAPDRGIDMLFVMNAGKKYSGGVNRNVSFGVIHVRMDKQKSFQLTLEQLHWAISSKRKDIFGIANHPEGNALLTSIVFEITGEPEETCILTRLESEWDDAQRATGSNAELVVDGAATRNENCTSVSGFIVDKVTRSQDFVRIVDFNENVSTGVNSGFKIKHLLRGKPEFKYRRAVATTTSSESDLESLDLADYNDDVLSIDTLSSTSYVMNDDDFSTGDDVSTVETDNDDDDYRLFSDTWRRHLHM